MNSVNLSTEEMLKKIKDQEKMVTAESSSDDSTRSEVVKEDLKSKIEDLQQELGYSPKINKREGSLSSKSYLDEYGDETFYVKNISDRHVLISDIPDFGKIERGKCEDLRQFSDMETLKKSRDLKVALSGYGDRKLLERITPEEFYQYLKEAYENKKKVDIMKKKKEPVPETENKKEVQTRPVILSKIEKLRLSSSSDPEIAIHGITNIEFMDWIASEKLTEDEIEFIMGMVNDRSVRTVLIQKKQSLYKG